MAGIWQNLLGTAYTTFQFASGYAASTSANIIRSVANAIEARNSTNSAYIVGRGADPVGNNDWVTLQYGNANYLSSADVDAMVQEIRFTFDETGNTSGTSIPAGAFVIDAQVKVTTAFTTSGDPVAITVTRGADELVADDENNPAAVGLYDVQQDNVIAATGVVTVTVVNADAGAGVCIVRFVKVPLN